MAATYFATICLLVLSVSAVSQTYGSFRRDFYTNPKLYPESFAKLPTHGGRVHLVFNSAITTAIAKPLTVLFNDHVKATLDPSGGLPVQLDWIYCDHNAKTGEIITSFHSKNDTFLSSISSLTILDAQQNTVVRNQPVAMPPVNFPVRITYVTTRKNYSEMIVHVHNYDEKDAYDVTDLTANGQIKTAFFTIKPSQHMVFVLPLFNVTEGDFWSVGMQVGNPPVLVGNGGRLGKEIAPFESWPVGDQCPLPVQGANLPNYYLLKSQLKMDAVYVHGKACDADMTTVLKAAAASQGEYYILPNFDTKHAAVPATDGIAAVFLADENDTKDNTTDAWQIGLRSRDWYPTLLTYQGGHTSSYNGVFAGITDIQGLDFYIAGCAPHVTDTLTTPPVRGSFDYLRNARNNHMPLTHWGYSQGYSSHSELSAAEMSLSIASAFAAGSKGIMLYQSDVDRQDTPDWKAGSYLLTSFNAIKEMIRQGDVEGAKYDTHGDTDVIVSVIQAPQPDPALIIIAINTDAHGYNSLLCKIDIDIHWEFNEHTIDTLSVTLPQQWTAKNYTLSENKGGVIEPAGDVSWRVEGDQIVINSIGLPSKGVVARVFIVQPK